MKKTSFSYFSRGVSSFGLQHRRSKVEGPSGLVFGLLTFLILFAFLTNYNASGQEGLHTVAGAVYDSDGEPLNSTHQGVYAAIIVSHDGENHTYADPDGLTSGWYVVTLPEGAWYEGDRYWVVVDGTPWGDVNYTCHGYEYADASWWRLTGGGSEQRNVATLNEIPTKEEPKEEENYKPILALIIIIILLILGVLVARKRPLNLTEPKAWVVDGVFQKFTTPPRPQEAGKKPQSKPGPDTAVPAKVETSGAQPQGQKQEQSVKLAATITQSPDDLPSAVTVKPYTEARAEAEYHQNEKDEVGKHLAEIGDKVIKLDEKFELAKFKDIQAKKAEKLKKDRIYTGIILILPFVILEIIMATLSLYIDLIKVPPWDGAGLFINVIILIIGALVGLAGFKKGYKIMSEAT